MERSEKHPKWNEGADYERRAKITNGMLARVRLAQAARGTRQKPTAEQRARDEQLVRDGEAARR